MDLLLDQYIFTTIIIIVIVEIIRLFLGWIFRTKEVIHFQKSQLRQMQKQLDIQGRMIKLMQDQLGSSDHSIDRE